MDWISIAMISIAWMALLGTPIVAAFAWRVWSTRERFAPRNWRGSLMLMGLLTSSANALLYYSWLAYRLIVGLTVPEARLFSAFLDVAVYLVPLALAGAICGKGAPRVPIAVCALLGYFNWVVAGSI